MTFLADPGSPSDEARQVLSAWVTDHGSDTRPRNAAPVPPHQ
jgi:hypothetical protein